MQLDIKRKLRKRIMPFLLKNVWYVNMSGREQDQSIFSNVDFVRYSQIENILQKISDENRDGDMAELGVYKGDLTKLISSKMPNEKTLHLFDTFSGFSSVDAKNDIVNGYSTADEDFSNTSVELVLSKCGDKNVVVHKGYFPDTSFELTGSEKFCFVSIDMDLAEPTKSALNYFWDKMSLGGYIVVHDYLNKEYKGVKYEVDKFLAHNDIFNAFVLCDYCGSIFIRKSLENIYRR